MTTYKISRCSGSVTCWSATLGAHDFGCGTDYDLGRLIERLCERSLEEGEPVPSFFLDVTTEAEAAALARRVENERQRLTNETKRAQRTIRDNKKRLAELTVVPVEN